VLAIVIAQNSQNVPDEGTGIGLILLGVAIFLAVVVGVFLFLRRASKGVPGNLPQDPGHVGVSDPPDVDSGARITPQRRGVEQSGSSSGS
jgi:hypothetical protein